MTSYSSETPFDASMMVYFRQRIDINLVNRINQEMVKKMREITASESDKKKTPGQKSVSHQIAVN